MEAPLFLLNLLLRNGSIMSRPVRRLFCSGRGGRFASGRSPVSLMCRFSGGRGEGGDAWSTAPGFGGKDGSADADFGLGFRGEERGT